MSNEMITRVIGRIKPAADAPFFITGAENIDAAEIRGVPSSFPDTSLKNYLQNIQNQLQNDLIEITNFMAIDINTGERIIILEKGDYRNVRLVWEYNTEPSIVIINGHRLDNPSDTYYDVGYINSDTIWNIIAYDIWGNESLAKQTTIQFYDRICYGVLDKNYTITEDILKSFPYFLLANYQTTFTLTPENNQYIYYIAPKNLRNTVPCFTINGLTYEWDCVNPDSDFIFTNDFGQAIAYQIWRHPQIITEKITVNVL